MAEKGPRFNSGLIRWFDDGVTFNDVISVGRPSALPLLSFALDISRCVDLNHVFSTHSSWRQKLLLGNSALSCAFRLSLAGGISSRLAQPGVERIQETDQNS